MNKILQYLAAGAAVAVLAGCGSTTLPTGRYISEKDPGVHAMVYKDLIFVTVKAPKRTTGKFADWVWAGKYSINELGELELKMDSETSREWRFFYTLSATNRGIQLNDWSNNQTELMRYAAPKRLAAPPEPAVRYEED